MYNNVNEKPKDQVRHCHECGKPLDIKNCFKAAGIPFCDSECFRDDQAHRENNWMVSSDQLSA